jgi:hypothetical protein
MKNIGWLAMGLAYLLVSHTAHAKLPEEPLQFNGSAKLDGQALLLTPAQGNQSGSAFIQRQVALGAFSTWFRFQIGQPGGRPADCNTEPGADGLVFVVQSKSSSIGGLGAGMGYAGVEQSVAIEFDSWCNSFNGDPDSNHVALLVGGVVRHKDHPVVSLPEPLDDGQPWDAWVDYDGTHLELRLARDGKRPSDPVLRAPIDIGAELDADRGWAGFTAGTGSNWGRHEVLGWTQREEHNPVAGPNDPTVPPVTAAGCTCCCCGGTSLALLMGALGIAGRRKAKAS